LSEAHARRAVLNLDVLALRLDLAHSIVFRDAPGTLQVAADAARDPRR
jgi:hypothetical protein